MDSKPRKWRIENQNRPKGTYFVMASGSRKQKSSISLGYVPAKMAALACQRANEDEMRTHGTELQDRILRGYRKLGRNVVWAFLTDQDADGLFVVEPNYSRWPLQRYVDEVYGPHRSTTKPKTWRTERFDWTYILPEIGTTTLGGIDEYNVDDFLEKLQRRRGGPASPNMKRKCRNAITACLRYARRKKHRPGLIPTWFDLEGTSQTRPITNKSLTVEEVFALVDHSVGWVPEANGQKPRNASWSNAKAKWQGMWAVLFGSGLRPVEAAHLDWSDLDLASGTLWVAVAEVSVKTAMSRAVIPLTPFVVTHLSRWSALRGHPTSGLVFPSRRGAPYITTGSTGFSKSLRASATAAGITKNVTPYWGRHTFGTISTARIGADKTAKLLRHTSVEMVRRHYDHSSATRIEGWETVVDAFERK